MTSSLPPEVREVFERYLTTELVTVDSGDAPIVWPVTPYYGQGAATIDVTTGIGYPKKALDARRNPSVALLFSDPTGSGIESGIQVLVQGTAEVDDADLAANRRRYRQEALRKLPGMKSMVPPRILENLFGWYYDRLYIDVRPERVFVWADGDLGDEPQVLDAHLEEVRSGHVEEPAEVAEKPPRPAPGAWDERMQELGRRHESAVLAWLAPDGFPLAARVPVAAESVRRRIEIGRLPAGLPAAEGRACVVAHAHDPDFTWQENFQVRGDLVREDDAWALVPRRLVGGFALPEESLLARYRRNLGKAVRFYRTRRRILRERGSRV